ncbi:TetR/AcrR family transcriptional regulator [Rhizobium jaguaris]|uniref:TetR/AcrR family transcriptional regulator n=1 Tax=Rhizobium jaguaris TaxID=1312183 RepID=UPI0039BFD01F
MMAKTKSDMREAVMAAAKAAVQAHGYNALSFRELAKDVGIKSASVHYHFPTKGALGAALARRYTEDGATYLDELLVKSQDPKWCMDRYAEVFRAALANENRMCLCGIMSAELDDLPPEVRSEVDNFAAMNVAWLARVLKLANPDAAEHVLNEHAMAIFAAIEGAQLIARGCRDIAIYDRTVQTYRQTGLIP